MAVLKNYVVTRRVAIWMDATIKAESLEDALAREATMKDSAFFKVNPGVEFVDSERLPGTGVREEF